MVSGCYSVRPSVILLSLRRPFHVYRCDFSGRIYMKFNIGDFYENLLRNSKFCENQAKASVILYVFLLPTLSLTEVVSSY